MGEVENMKGSQTDGLTDAEQQVMRKDQFCFQLGNIKNKKNEFKMHSVA